MEKGTRPPSVRIFRNRLPCPPAGAGQPDKYISGEPVRDSLIDASDFVEIEIRGEDRGTQRTNERSLSPGVAPVCFLLVFTSHLRVFYVEFRRSSGNGLRFPLELEIALRTSRRRDRMVGFWFRFS